jgi:hypothetical protein
MGNTHQHKSWHDSPYTPRGGIFESWQRSRAALFLAFGSNKTITLCVRSRSRLSCIPGLRLLPASGNYSHCHMRRHESRRHRGQCSRTVRRPRCHRQLGVYSAWVGTSPPPQDQDAREPQKIFACGRISGVVSSVPAGITTSRPLRVKCGSGPPHDAQTVVAKL